VVPFAVRLERRHAECRVRGSEQWRTTVYPVEGTQYPVRKIRGTLAASALDPQAAECSVSLNIPPRWREAVTAERMPCPW